MILPFFLSKLQRNCAFFIKILFVGYLKERQGNHFVILLNFRSRVGSGLMHTT